MSYPCSGCGSMTALLIFSQLVKIPIYGIKGTSRKPRAPVCPVAHLAQISTGNVMVGSTRNLTSPASVWLCHVSEKYLLPSYQTREDILKAACRLGRINSETADEQSSVLPSQARDLFWWGPYTISPSFTHPKTGCHASASWSHSQLWT